MYRGFRFFRIVQIMKNSHGSDNLCLSGLELYGTAFGIDWNSNSISSSSKNMSNNINNI